MMMHGTERSSEAIGPRPPRHHSPCGRAKTERSVATLVRETAPVGRSRPVAAIGFGALARQRTTTLGQSTIVHVGRRITAFAFACWCVLSLPLAPVCGQSPPATPQGSPTSSLKWVQTPTGPVLQSQLRHLGWQRLIKSVQSLIPDRVTLTQIDNSPDLAVNLPAPGGRTTLRINPQTGHYQLQGELAPAWLRVIQWLDRAPADESDTTQLVSVGGVDPKTISRTVNLLRMTGSDPQRAARWGGDLLGIGAADEQAAGAGKPTRTFIELNRADTDTDTDNALAQADLQEPPPTPEREDPTPSADPLAPNTPQTLDDEGMGVEGEAEGTLMGPVQVEFVEGLDAIIVRGRKPDVDRVLQIIEQLEQISEITEPAVELHMLEHVNSQSMTDLVNELNSTLAARRGTISITALIKPNAILLIGRPESVEATLKLIEQLDQPVAPASQFQIFRLKHMPVTDAEETIITFFEERGGLGPNIQVQSDFRTNSLIVYASPRDMEEVRYLIEKIDVSESEVVNRVQVFKLKNALAEELAPVLESTLRGEAVTGLGGGPGGAAGGQGQAATRSSMLTLTRIDATGQQTLRSGLLTDVRVAADARANSLVVTAPEESMELIAALVQQLDELPTSEAQIKVFTIVNGDASSLAEMLNQLFGEAFNQQQSGPFPSGIGAGESSLVPLRFSVDLRTNSIIATGAAPDLDVVEAILLRLDESDIRQRKNRVYRLLNAPAQDVALAINQLIASERQVELLAPEAISPFEQIEREVIVVPEIVSNSLLISATPRYFDEIAELVQELDERPPMVLIQVLIAEVDLSNTDELGVELGIQDSLLFDRSSVVGGLLEPGFNFNNRPLGNANTPEALLGREKTAGQGITSFAVGRTNQQLGYGGLVLSANSESINILIRALQESRRLDILSRPQVMTLNNQPAFVQVGQRVPRVTSTSQTAGVVTNATTLENVGLLLGVTPRISPDGLVVMEIDAEKSELSDEGIPISISATGDVITSPIIDTTVAQTTVSARSGQTVILGGLITKSRGQIERAVPYLSDVPLLGALFRYDFASEDRSELLIIMTPYIVRKPEDADWLLQMESERMSWCLADVIDVHGTDGSFSLLPSGMSQPEVIYPDKQPTAPRETNPGNGEMIPTPNAAPKSTTPWQQQDLIRPPLTGERELPQSMETEPITQSAERSIAPVQYLNSNEKGESRWPTQRRFLPRSR